MRSLVLMKPKALAVFACKAARLKINEEFRKNRTETSEESINQVNDIFPIIRRLLPLPGPLVTLTE